MSRGARSIRTAIAWGGLIAGTIDIGAATLINLVSPIVILHAIASGVLGRAAFVGGVPAALLGLLLQWIMSLIIAAVFVAACHIAPLIARRWVAGGLGYGVVIFVVMNYIVVPLSAAMAEPHLPHFTVARFAGNMAAMLLFGLIVAWFASDTVRAEER